MELDHHNHDCAGEWRAELRGRDVFFVCSGCRASVFYTLEAMQEVAADRDAAATLRALTQAGMRLLRPDP